MKPGPIWSTDCRFPVIAGPAVWHRALRQLWRASRGIPRLINILAQKCLMLAYGQGRARSIVGWCGWPYATPMTPAARAAALVATVLLPGCALAYGVWQ